MGESQLISQGGGKGGGGGLYTVATWGFGHFYGMFARGIVATYEEYTELGIDEISCGVKSAVWGIRNCHSDELFSRNWGVDGTVVATNITIELGSPGIVVRVA